MALYITMSGPIVGYQCKADKIKSAKLIESEDIRLVFVFPLDAAVTLPVHCAGGFSREDVKRAIAAGYSTIYADPGRYGMPRHDYHDLRFGGIAECGLDTYAVKAHSAAKPHYPQYPNYWRRRYDERR